MSEAAGAEVAPATRAALDALCHGLDDANGRLEGVAHHTPVVTSHTLDQRAGARVFLKCENLQRMGAFKFRGAWNMISRVDEAARARGVVAYSSGNHAQAVALVARLHGVPATIVMPSGAPPTKIAAVREYGAEILFYDSMGEGREALAERIARERGVTLVPPFDHPDIVCGQGTAADELFEEAGPLDALLVPLGGGGLLSGSALAASVRAAACRVIGVEPEAGDDGARSFRSGRLERVESPDTIADGARTPSLGRLTFSIIRALVADVVTVPDAALLDAVRFGFERLKLVIEPTGALGLAALLSGAVRADAVRGAGGGPPRIGVMLSGGNVDPASLAARIR